MRKIVLIVIALTFGLSIHAQDKAFKKTMKIEGRIMYDFNFLSDGDDYNYAGNEFRRVRMAAKGMVTKNIGYKAEFDFSGGVVNFRDVYLKYKMGKKNGDLLFGSFTEPASLNNMTSSKYITFFERAMMANTQPFKYNAGIMYNNQKLMNGKLGLQLAYTFNGVTGVKADTGSGKLTGAFTDKSIQEGANFIARVTSAIINDKENHKVVHLGVNYEHRDNDSGDYSYKFRTENHMGKKQEVGNLAGVFENTSDIGFEFAATYGSLSVQGEYEAGTINTDDKDYKTVGYYAFVSYFVTGEHRPYKNSSFGRVKPKNSKYGALELVLRYSAMNMNDTFDVDGVDDKEYAITNITAGFNWYLNNNTRIMYNYVSGDHNDMDLTGGFAYEEGKLKGHLIRFQVDF